MQKIKILHLFYFLFLQKSSKFFLFVIKHKPKNHDKSSKNKPINCSKKIFNFVQKNVKKW